MLRTTNAEFRCIEIWFTDQDNRSLEIEDNLKIGLIIGTGQYKWDIQLNKNIEIMLKVMAFCHLLENLEINMVKN